MTHRTDERLRSYLDTNQLGRERLCLAVLAIDKRFSDVRPRHPRGGRDGGIDIDATYKAEQSAAGAVGFVNGANDSDEQKTKIKKKFKTDAQAAYENERKPKMFVFFTNVDLTITEEADLKGKAKAIGFADCDIFDRERIRVALDSADGFAARFQYLDLPLSDAEQASFFARWGDDIQSLVSTGFQRVERTLDRLLFLQEADNVLGTLSIHYELDRTYDADEIGHFRAFCHMFLKEPRHEIFQILFGSSDGSQRFSDNLDSRGPAGIRHGISGGQWEKRIIREPSSKDKDAEDEQDIDQQIDNKQLHKYKMTRYSSGIGMEELRLVSVIYNHDQPLFRIHPRMRLRDLDEAGYLHCLNASLAEKVKAIHVYANGYKLAEFSNSQFTIDRTEFESKIPVEFTGKELADPWVRIRWENCSFFMFDFFGSTPRRCMVSKQTPDSLGR